MNQAKYDLQKRVWKRIGGQYEPVGLPVLVLCKSGEILLGSRAKPAEAYYKPNTYYRVCGENTPLEALLDPLWWDYP